MQFCPRVEAEPATLVIDAETQKQVVTFWHDHLLAPEAPVAQTYAARNQVLTAIDVGMWWTEPGKYSIEGYDDALTAMRRVHEVRQWLIGVIKGTSRILSNGRNQKNSVTTNSLHVASCIMACSTEAIIAFDRNTFVFKSTTADIAALVHDAANESRSPLQRGTVQKFGKDLCIDWMYAALVCRDKLMGFVRQCIAQIERRDGDRVLRLSSQMPKALRREFVRRW